LARSAGNHQLGDQHLSVPTRSVIFGHVRQLDAVAARFLTGLAVSTQVVTGVDEHALVDIDDTLIEVHGHAKGGSGYGYSGVRGLNALIATVTTSKAAPLIVAQRLRKGSCGSPRGAKRLVCAGEVERHDCEDEPSPRSR